MYNTKHALVTVNTFYGLHENRSIFTRIRERKSRQTKTLYIKIFQLCCNVLIQKQIKFILFFRYFFNLRKEISFLFTCKVCLLLCLLNNPKMWNINNFFSQYFFLQTLFYWWNKSSFVMGKGKLAKNIKLRKSYKEYDLVKTFQTCWNKN